MWCLTQQEIAFNGFGGPYQIFPVTGHSIIAH